MHPVPLGDVLAGDDSPLALTRLLESRDNAAREAAVGRYLEQRGVPVARHRFSTFEGRGENLSVEIGSGDRALVLIAHHDAVPGSPGANDNAAAVGILLHLLPRLVVPPSLRVRLLFTAAEELGYPAAHVVHGTARRTIWAWRMNSASPRASSVRALALFVLMSTPTLDLARSACISAVPLAFSMEMRSSWAERCLR